jgi:hypothetical protein
MHLFARSRIPSGRSLLPTVFGSTAPKPQTARISPDNAKVLFGPTDRHVSCEDSPPLASRRRQVRSRHAVRPSDLRPGLEVLCPSVLWVQNCETIGYVYGLVDHRGEVGVGEDAVRGGASAPSGHRVESLCGFVLEAAGAGGGRRRRRRRRPRPPDVGTPEPPSCSVAGEGQEPARRPSRRPRFGGTPSFGPPCW